MNARKTRRRAPAVFFLILAMVCAIGTAYADGWQKYELPRGTTKKSPYIHYWVYTPAEMEEGLPMIVYLHSTAGMVNSALKDAYPAMMREGTIATPRAVILIPQHPGRRDSSSYWSSAIDSVNTAAALVMEEYKVDPERTALAGFSLGGIGVWEVAAAAPGRYKRILCVDGRVDTDVVSADAFAGCRVRVINAENDPTINPETAIAFVKELKEGGGDASYVALPLKHSDMQRVVFADEEVLEWLHFEEPDVSREKAE